ncbi:7585_t:CDS:2, partial [Dentiscutata heterogama]
DLSNSNIFLVCLLDPRCKKLRSAVPTQRCQTEPTVFMQDTSEELNDKLDNYLSLPEIHYKSNPFNW